MGRPLVRRILTLGLSINQKTVLSNCGGGGKCLTFWKEWNSLPAEFLEHYNLGVVKARGNGVLLDRHDLS